MKYKKKTCKFCGISSCRRMSFNCWTNEKDDLIEIIEGLVCSKCYKEMEGQG